MLVLLVVTPRVGRRPTKDRGGKDGPDSQDVGQLGVLFGLLAVGRGETLLHG